MIGCLLLRVCVSDGEHDGRCGGKSSLFQFRSCYERDTNRKSEHIVDVILMLLGGEVAYWVKSQIWIIVKQDGESFQPAVIALQAELSIIRTLLLPAADEGLQAFSVSFSKQLLVRSI